jgi:protein-S-isoprenylcysteine O-methyltransferase Ste14
MSRFPLPTGVRTARPASAAVNLGKTMLQVLVMWGLFLALLPWLVMRVEEALGLAGWRFGGPEWRAAGAVIFVVCGAIGLYCGVVFAVRGRGTPLPLDATTRFLVFGPYRYVRNPMAACGIAQGVAVGLIVGSPLVVAYAVAGGLVWHFLARPWEEADLLARFGEPYARYRSQVRCWIPHVRPYPKVEVETPPALDAER